MAKNIEAELSRTIIGLLIREPFFAHLLSGITREVSDKTATVALKLEQTGPRLLVNESYFLNTLKSDKQRLAILKHEALHIAFGHFHRRRPNHITELYDIAADLVVNQFLDAGSLPPDPVNLDSFPGLNLEPNDTLENYYSALMIASANQNAIRRSVETDSDSTEDLCNARFSNGFMNLDSASGSGESEPLPGDNVEGDFSTDTFAYSKAATRFAGDHRYWGESDAATEYAVDSLLLRARDRTSIAHWGTIPGPIGDLISMIIESRTPQVDWRRQLRIFGSSSRRTRVVHTMKRVSRRYGTRPGIRIKRFHNLLVAVDTSGSVDHESIELLFSEIYGMWKTGSEITVIECDHEVQRVYPYRGQTPQSIGGGGGTSFDPVFDYARTQRLRPFDGLIYLTDGYAEQPTIRPLSKLLWVLTPDGTDEQLRFGRKIRLH